ncbi:MAG TPA: hypothetical protein VFY03_11650 [Woeseiaceae bacterium]|nr:hypothetical protein [Woeseiaceae bacterium]
MYRPGRRRLLILLIAAVLAAIVLAAISSTLRMPRGATSDLDEGDDRQRPVPSPVSAPSPSAENDDPTAGNDDVDLAPGTSDEDADEAGPDEPRGQEMPGEAAPDTGSVTGADDKWKEEDNERQ